MRKTKILAALLLIFFGVIGRLLIVEFIKIPNLEIITSFSLIAGAMLGGIFTFLVPLSIIALTDIYFGNTFILIFTWSAFGIIGIFGRLLKKRKSFNFRFIFEMTGMGAISSLFFYLYTNFGWWVLAGIYPLTWQGLIHCYIMGLPFLRTNLLGNLFLVPLFTFSALLVWRYYPVFKSEFLNIFKTRYKYDSFR
ncbi:hypothetical protein KJA17_00215 [Patescibacteria group bacterium]|nr:hypothetical protein [Patescibacteria group bacterium]